MAVEMNAVGLGDPWRGHVLRFRDNASGYDFSMTTPARSPRLWKQYLAGALKVYRHFGIEDVLGHDAVADGRSTALFCAATDPAGEMVGGVRIQGPYTWVSEMASLAPWSGRPGGDDLIRMIARRIPRGVVEARGAWVARSVPRRGELAAAISRCIAHAPRIMGVRYGFATVASFTTERHRGSGGVVAELIPPVPYPDERYRTVPIWWDTRTYRVFADGLQYLLMRGELRAMGITDTAPTRAYRPLGHRGESVYAYGR